jgi:hypothetical protein
MIVASTCISAALLLIGPHFIAGPHCDVVDTVWIGCLAIGTDGLTDIGEGRGLQSTRR